MAMSIEITRRKLLRGVISVFSDSLRDRTNRHVFEDSPQSNTDTTELLNNCREKSFYVSDRREYEFCWWINECND